MLPPPPYGITNPSGATPSSSTISKTAVFWPATTVRVDRVDEHVRAAVGELPRGRERVVEVARTSSTFAPSIRVCATFGPATAPSGVSTTAGMPGPGGIGGARGGGVARGGADDRLGPFLDRLRDGHRHAAVLVRARRVRRLPLQPQLDAEALRQARHREQRRRALAERDHRRRVGHRQARTEPLDQRHRHAQPSSATPRPEITGIALASPLASGSARIASRALATRAAGRLVRDDVQHRVAVARLLHELGDRDLLGGELLCDPGEDAGAVLDLEPKVERRGEVAERQLLERSARPDRSGGSRCPSCRRWRPCRPRRPRPSRARLRPGPRA